MKAMVLRDRQLAVEEVERPTAGPGEVLARVLACGICGSDLHAAKYMDEMMANAQRSGRNAFEDFDGNGIVMGHEFVAEVVESGPGAESWSAGTRVTSIPVLVAPQSPNGMLAIGYAAETPGAYGEFVRMSAPLLLKVPDNLSDEVAATTEPCAVGLHAVRQGRVSPNEHVVIMGAGPIGLMTLIWLKHDGVEHVTVSDFAPARRELAKNLGADLVVDPKAQDVLQEVSRACGGAPPVAFECVGVEGTLSQAMELVERGGRVVVVGVCMKPDTIRPMVGITKQLTLQFVLGYTPEEYAETLTALGEGRVDTSPLVTRTVSLDELPAAFEALADPADCKIVLRM